MLEHPGGLALAVLGVLIAFWLRHLMRCRECGSFYTVALEYREVVQAPAEQQHLGFQVVHVSHGRFCMACGIERLERSWFCRAEENELANYYTS